MKASGVRTKGAAVDTRCFQMAIRIMEHMRRVKPTAKVSISGRMEKSTTVSGYRESRMVTVSGKEQMERVILDSGSNQRLKDMVFMSLPMAINTKENGMHVSERATDLTFSQMETATLDSTIKGSLKGSVNISGRMAAVTLDNSIMV